MAGWWYTYPSESIGFIFCCGHDCTDLSNPEMCWTEGRGTRSCSFCAQAWRLCADCFSSKRLQKARCTGLRTVHPKVPGLFGWLGSSPKKRMVGKILYLDRDQPGGCVGQINILYFDAYPKYQQHQETNTTHSQYSHYRGKKVLQSRVYNSAWMIWLRVRCFSNFSSKMTDFVNDYLFGAADSMTQPPVVSPAPRVPLQFHFVCLSGIASLPLVFGLLEPMGTDWNRDREGVYKAMWSYFSF